MKEIHEALVSKLQMTGSLTREQAQEIAYAIGDLVREIMKQTQ